MAKLIMTRGLPGSGKSYWAERQVDFLVISKDDIRAELETSGWKWSRENEKDVIKLETDKILGLLRDGKSVIADSTNFGKHEARLKSLADQCGAEFAVRDFTDVPLKICLERNREREKKVPEEFIIQQYRDYVEPFLVPKPVGPWDDNLPYAVICDLDGTLATHVGRGPYDEDKCDTDEVNKSVQWALRAFQAGGTKLIFLSGRKDRVREKTEKWLENKAGFEYPYLLMRKSDDNRNDAIVKNELFDEHIRGRYNVVCVLDDRDRVVKRWRELGLSCFQVNYGAF